MYSWIAAFDPPHGIGGEAEALFGLESLDRLHQADIALGDHLGDRQPVAAVAHGDLGDQAQVAGDELVSCVAVAVLAPTLRQHVFILRFQHGKPQDLLEIPGKAGVTDSERPSCDLRDQGGALLFEIRPVLLSLDANELAEHGPHFGAT